MNSFISYKWLSHYVDLKGVKPDEFAARMSLSGPAVEKIMPRGELLDKVVVGKIKKIKKHPNADKLKLVVVEIGSKSVDVVCGGTNLVEGHLVALAQIGAHVLWHGEGEPVLLEPAEIRGVKSKGMICAANEIGLADAFPHDDYEILDLTESVPDLNVKPGTPLADALGLSKDVVMDIEVTSNRVDAMGMVGMAREASTILGKKFLWKGKELKRPAASRQQPAVGVAVTVHDKKLCPRYMAVRITGVKNGSSPWWMKERLMSAGLNSISLLVDITNYVLQEYAQPMHVFDVKKLKAGKSGPEIHVRLARSGEKIKALDGNDYKLDDRALVIADAKGPVAVAGIMGGERSGVYDDTSDIIFECATFDPVSVRKTSRRINLYSDSQLRFEKGLSTEAVPLAMARAVELALELGGGEVTAVKDVRGGVYKSRTVSIASKEINDRIGTEVPKSRQTNILRDLGFVVSEKKGILHATVPWWRDHDVEAGVDIIEEIARILEYDALTPIVPIALAPRSSDQIILWEDRLREAMRAAGYTECYGYSFVSRALLEKSSYDADSMLRIQNPLTNEWEFMRPSLLPSLLMAASENAERFPDMCLFECANAYVRQVGDSGNVWKHLPDESPELACVIRISGDQEPWRLAKGIVEHLLISFGVTKWHIDRVTSHALWHPGRSAHIYVENKPVAMVGEIAPRVCRAFKLSDRIGAVAMDIRMFASIANAGHAYVPPSPFPEAKRDIALVVDEGAEYDDIARLIAETDPLITDVEWFDTYRGKGLPEGKKSVAVHLTLASPERTLTSKDVDGIIERVERGLKEKFKAEIRY